MEKKSLKVFINRADGSYCGGMLLVAANDIEEAHEVALADEGLEYNYWEDDWEHDSDIAADPSVITGLKAVLNVMANPQTWIYARDKADELNKITDKQTKQ